MKGGILMKWQKFLLGLTVGFAGGYLVNRTISSRPLTAEKALQIVKDSFKKSGPIIGSWIHMVPETYNKFDMSYVVYKGGISRKIGDDVNQYEFVVDSKTGTILDVIPR